MDCFISEYDFAKFELRHEGQPQTTKIYDFMDEFGSITDMDAFRLGICRLAARISDLRKLGLTIQMDWETKNGKRYGRYKLVNKNLEEKIC